ncbi:hypothetical protein PIB30_079056 [Stylosanthes scabra]|uniref:Uncharacterized protein n=1 Tax=Stylosanthes scabra TaxID=79078 RepID=A0ABU6VS87_9FABA|nr:hypothetical protein [Stylosanthes scabra]
MVRVPAQLELDDYLVPLRKIQFGVYTLLSQPLSNQWRSIPTLFLYVNQEGREDALLNEEDVESLDHKVVHECIEDVEEENEDQEAEDIDQEVKDKDKEPKGDGDCSFRFI